MTDGHVNEVLISVRVCPHLDACFATLPIAVTVGADAAAVVVNGDGRDAALVHAESAVGIQEVLMDLVVRKSWAGEHREGGGEEG